MLRTTYIDWWNTVARSILEELPWKVFLKLIQVSVVYFTFVFFLFFLLVACSSLFKTVLSGVSYSVFSWIWFQWKSKYFKNRFNSKVKLFRCLHIVFTGQVPFYWCGVIFYCYTSGFIGVQYFSLFSLWTTTRGFNFVFVPIPQIE